ncbi:MAG: lipoyl(octanoyl) transferase LipB [Bacteroidota bacterium]
MQQIQYRDCGRIDYQEAWDLQERLLKANTDIKLAAGRGADPFARPTEHHLLFCEHPPVYTLGKSGLEENLLIDAAEREKRSISYYKINRGGDITYHGPGQITGYPIFVLEKFRTDIGWYLRNMEDVMIRLLADYGLEGGRIAGATGVWLDINSDWPRKICAMGVRCSRWVTMHGFAFNVNTDLDFFSHIVPCGIDDKGVTSLAAELGYTLDMDDVKSRLKQHFAAVFAYEYA